MRATCPHVHAIAFVLHWMCNDGGSVFHKKGLWLDAATLLMGFMAFVLLCVMEIQKIFVALKRRSVFIKRSP